MQYSESSKYAVFIIFRLGQARPWATTDSSGVLSDHELFPVPLPCSPTHSFSRLNRAIFTPYLSPPFLSKVLSLPLPIPKLLHSTWSHVWPKPKKKSLYWRLMLCKRKITVGYDRLLWGFVRPRTFPCSSSLLSYPFLFAVEPCHFHPLPFSSIPVQGTFSPTTYSQTPSLDMVSCLANANNVIISILQTVKSS